VHNNLDLYAKVEDLLGVDEVAPSLYKYYTEYLKTIKFDSILDIGCGSGEFLLSIEKEFNPQNILGVDLSNIMIQKAKDKGVNAKAIDISNLDENFEVITAVFDMLNYLNRPHLIEFLQSVENILSDDGIFMLDINSLDGFEQVAVGSYIVDDDERFLTIDSYFTDEIYYSDFTLFTKENNLYKKEQEVINQYFYTIKEIESHTLLKLIEVKNISLYQEVDDKIFLIFKK
jgi:predicted TPR repeat methyltransferase